MTKHATMKRFFHLLLCVSVLVLTIQYSWLTITRANTLQANEKLGLLEQVLAGSHYKKTKDAYKMFFRNAQGNLNISDRCPISGFLTVSDGGRLGNLMGEYATLYAYAKQDGFVPVISPEMKKTLKNYFPLISIVSYEDFDFSCNFTAKNVTNWKFNRLNTFDGNYNISEHPCNIKLFNQYKEEIKQEFRFKQYFIDKAAARIKEVVGSRNDVVLVGVHVRRTDYSGYLEYMTGDQIAGADYIRKAMSRYKSKFQNVVFVMMSDDMLWCKLHFKNDEDVYSLGDGSTTNPGADLAVLSMCNHSIITHGTFGFWGAYLADGIVTLPGSPSGANFGLLKGIRTAQLPNWTIITGAAQHEYVNVKRKT